MVYLLTLPFRILFGLVLLPFALLAPPSTKDRGAA